MAKLRRYMACDAAGVNAVFEKGDSEGDAEGSLEATDSEGVTELEAATDSEGEVEGTEPTEGVTEGVTETVGVTEGVTETVGVAEGIILIVAAVATVKVPLAVPLLSYVMAEKK